MAAVRQMALWAELRSAPAALFLATVALCLVRARDQPSLDVGVGGTTASIVPADVAAAALAVVALVALVRTGLPRVARLAVVAAAGFCALVAATGAANGSAALVSGLKFDVLAALGLGAVALVRRERLVEATVDLLLLFTLVADAVGLVRFVAGGGGRQPSFLGEHDFAALATLPLVYGLVLVFERRRGGRAATAIVAGGLGCVLGAALASLLGLYLAAAFLVVRAFVRRRVDLRALAVTALTLAAITGGTLVIRAGDLGFLQSWFGSPASRPGQYASSWSQRLIYAYVGGRIFVDHPLLGTGWYPDLPPKEYTPYLPAAERRFSDQPRRYFPPRQGTFIPQQALDQVLYELGAVGGALLLVLLVAAGRAGAVALAAGRLAALPLAWLAATIGAVAGEGFFGGTPLAATFWLTTGIAVAMAALAVRERV